MGIGEVLECIYDSAKYVGIVSHWDLDGIVAAALLIYGANEYSVSTDYRLSTPSRLLSSIEEVYAPAAILAVADLNPGQGDRIDDYVYVLARTSKTYWFDHHDWPEKVYQELSRLGKVFLVVDASKTSSELVAEHLTGACGLELKPSHREILRIAVTDDRNEGSSEDLYEARKWRILLRSLDWASKYRVVELIAEGETWTEWLEEAYSEASKEYSKLLASAIEKSRLYSSPCGLRIAVVVAHEKLNPSDVYEAVSARIDADIYAIYYGRGVSLRSKVVDVASLARRLGGGGHPRAAGARLKPGLGLDEVAEILAKHACREGLRAKH